MNSHVGGLQWVPTVGACSGGLQTGATGVGGVTAITRLEEIYRGHFNLSLV